LFDQRAVDAVYKVRRIEELATVDSYIFERNFRQIDLIFNAARFEKLMMFKKWLECYFHLLDIFKSAKAQLSH